MKKKHDDKIIAIAGHWYNGRFQWAGRKQENEILRDFQEKISLRYPGSQIILFGSRARGDAGPQSDADVVLILRNPPTEADQEFISDAAWRPDILTVW